MAAMIVRVGESSAIGAQFRAAAETGRVGALRACYAARARLVGAVPGREIDAVGREAIAAELATWWGRRGRIDDWHVLDAGRGVELVVERTQETDATGTRVRQRHWLHVRRDGLIGRHVVHSERPRVDDDEARRAPAPSFLRGATALEPLIEVGQSGARLERAVLAGGEPVVVKYLSPAASWIMRATRDTGREAQLWSSGALRELQAVFEVPIVAAEPCGDGWAVAQRDVAAALIPNGRRLTRAEARRLLTAADALHRHFQGGVPAAACALADRAELFSPRMARAERDGCDLVPKLVGRGWQQLNAVAAAAGLADISGAVLALVDEPAPLVAALEADGETLIHGDFQHANLGLADDRVIAIDWGMACRAPAEVELAWYLECGAPAVEATWDGVIADWRELRGGDVDPDRLALALLFEAVVSGWSWALFAADSPFPGERARSAAALQSWLRRAGDALERWSP